MLRKVGMMVCVSLVGWVIISGTAGGRGVADQVQHQSDGSSKEMYLECPALPGEPFFWEGMWRKLPDFEYWETEGRPSAKVAPMPLQAGSCNWERVVGEGFLTEDLLRGSLRNDYAWGMSTYTDPQGNEWLYVGTLNYGTFQDPGQAQVWRSSTGDAGSWEMVRVLEGCSGVRGMATYAGLLWLGTLNAIIPEVDPGGCEIWATDGTEWVLANEPGFGVSAMSTRGITVYRGGLYADAGQKADYTSAEVFKYTGLVMEGDLDSINPASWQSVASEGSVWIDPVNSIGVMEEFRGDLYVGTWSRGVVPSISSELGCDVYRYRGEEDVWERVTANGFGDPANAGVLSSAVFQDHLYLGVSGMFNLETALTADGADIWRTSNGDDWEAVTTNGNPGGSEPRNGNRYMWQMTVFDDYLLVGTYNFFRGCVIYGSKTGDPYSFLQVNIDGMEPGRNKVPVFSPQVQPPLPQYFYLNEQYGARTFTTFEDQLYLGTATWAYHADLIWRWLLQENGGEILDFPHSFYVGCEIWRLDHLPPVVTGLRADPEDERVELHWCPYREPGFDLAGYNVYRREKPGSPYERVASLLDTNGYTDLSLTNFIPYYYAVTAQNTCGIETHYSDALAVIPGIPQETFWVYPNPFQPNDYDVNTGTWEEGITFQFINYPGVHEVKIYTLAGELVVETQDADWIDEGGRLIWQWDTRNENGDRVASGLYLYLATCGAGEQRSGKIVVIK